MQRQNLWLGEAPQIFACFFVIFNLNGRQEQRQSWSLVKVSACGLGRPDLSQDIDSFDFYKLGDKKVMHFPWLWGSSLHGKGGKNSDDPVHSVH